MRARGFCLGVLLGLSGCGTILALTDAGPGNPLVYGGVRLEAGFLHEVFTTEGDPSASWGRMFTPLVILDLPFSLVLDTAVLPVTIPWALLSGEDEPDGG